MRKIFFLLVFIPFLSFSQEVLYQLNYSINENNLSKLGEVKENVEITIYSDRTLRVKKNGELFVNDSHISDYQITIMD